MTNPLHNLKIELDSNQASMMMVLTVYFETAKSDKERYHLMALAVSLIMCNKFYNVDDEQSRKEIIKQECKNFYKKFLIPILEDLSNNQKELNQGITDHIVALMEDEVMH